ncbi:hypothetical protein M595_5484 [Lyngbya aestuarii BL J]|uniref:Uncharacterized protein n=1 Tax=Lyngbya aestuarii BL J TaxID=1348334 RepID=U7QCX6_9CYAN|nr:hypothetical protein M595_5484 [Lyngbya aestuarii BL J]
MYRDFLTQKAPSTNRFGFLKKHHLFCTEFKSTQAHLGLVLNLKSMKAAVLVFDFLGGFQKLSDFSQPFVLL